MLAKKRTERKEVDLDAMVLTGQNGAYEALQLYRSRAIRFKSKNDSMGALNATAAGAKCLLENNYENAGAELADLFLDILTEYKIDLSENVKTLAMEIDDRFPKASPKRVEYLKGCVKYTVTCGNKESGDALFQMKLAECYWDKKDKNAAFHFAAGEAPLLYNTKIQETYPDASQQLLRDQAVTLGIVNFLALENLRDANELMFAFIKDQKARNFDISSELLKFDEYVLQTCKRDAAPLFKTLVNSYASILDFDEAIPALLLGPIALRFFNIKPKVNPMMSMIQSMFN